MVEKLAYTVNEAVALLPWGRTKVWELIRNNTLPARKKFGRIYVFHEDLVSLLAQSEAPNTKPTVKRAGA